MYVTGYEGRLRHTRNTLSTHHKGDESRIHHDLFLSMSILVLQSDDINAGIKLCNDQ